MFHQRKKNEFDSLIDELISEGKLVETKKGKIMDSEKLGLFAGEIFGQSKRLWLCSP